MFFFYQFSTKGVTKLKFNENGNQLFYQLQCLVWRDMRQMKNTIFMIRSQKSFIFDLNTGGRLNHLSIVSDVLRHGAKM